MIYKHFNQIKNVQNYWEGWANLRRLKVAPRVKHFIWLLLHNAVKTHDYLYTMNLDPLDLCSFCNLNVEFAEHIFQTCIKTRDLGPC